MSSSFVCAWSIWYFAMVYLFSRLVSTWSFTWLVILIYFRVSLCFWFFFTTFVKCTLNVFHDFWDVVFFFQSSTASLRFMCLFNWSIPWRMSTFPVTVSCRGTMMVCEYCSALKYTCTRSVGSYVTFVFFYCLRISSSVSSSLQKIDCRCLMICCGLFYPPAVLCYHIGLGRQAWGICTWSFVPLPSGA